MGICHNWKYPYPLNPCIILSGWFCPRFGEIEEKINENMTKCKATQTCTWYLIKKSYYNTLINCFTESKNNLTSNLEILTKYKIEKKRKILLKFLTKKNLSIDQQWKKLQKKDNWYRFNINLGYQKPDYSNICNKNVDYTYCLN